MTHALTLTGVSHDYGGGQVLHSVDLAAAAGEVHALLGMNGAGKSTLVHVATGHVVPTEGSIAVDGEPVRFAGPADAIRAGVALLAQEVDRGLAPGESVHENLTAGLLRAERRRLFSPRRNRARARALLAHYGVDLDVDRRVGTLSLYEKQALSLVRAAASNARFLVLDEPTSSFDSAQTQRFYGIVRRLKADGIAIVFISHRLHEVFELADWITVLRDGRVVLAAPAGDVTAEQVVDAITGGTLEAAHHRRGEGRGRPDAFRAESLDLGRGRAPLPLVVGAGEVVVVFGPLGSGKTSLARTVFGLGRPYRALVGGRPVRVADPVAARRAGIAVVPEERRAQGLWLDRDVRTHFALGFRGLVRTRAELDHAEAVARRYELIPLDPRQLVRRLSGGNQQKVAIGKWDGMGFALLVLDEPMKGIDVAAKESIFRRVDEAAAAGVGVLYLTQEPEDALRIADRIVVLGREGVVLDRPADELTALDLMLSPDADDEDDETDQNGAVTA